LYDIGLPESRTLHQNLQRVRSFVAREYGTPAVIVRRNEGYQLVVLPVARKHAMPESFDVSVLQGLSAHLSSLPDTYAFSDLSALSGDENRNVAAAFISFALQGPLFGNRENLWQGARGSIWYSKTSEVLSRKEVALYPGFSYRVLWTKDAGLCLCLDITHLYADTRTLAQRLAAGEDWRVLSGRHFVYEMGLQWFSIQFQKVIDQPISAARFLHPDGNGQQTDVYKYTMEKYKASSSNHFRQVRPDDATIIYNYPGRSDDRQGAVTLARLRYRTDDPEVSSLQQRTVLAPQERFERVSDIVAKHFDGSVSLDGVRLRISAHPTQVARRVFPAPAQRFGNGVILPSPGTAAASLRDVWQKRGALLRAKDTGFLGREGIATQFVLVPMSVGESLIEQITHDLTEALNEISPFKYEPKAVIWDDRTVQSVPELRKALASPKEQMERDDAACAVVVLPSQWSASRVGAMRRHIKKMLSPRVRTKCIQLDEIRRFLDVSDAICRVRPDTRYKYQSYLFYTALDTLVTSGYQPWAIAEPLEYDLHIGVDVLYNTAAFTFVALGGSIFRFRAIPTEQKEKISSKLMREQIVQNLKDLIPRIKLETGSAPRHVVIHRDGQLYDSEQEGLTRAIADLKSRNLLDDDVKFGVVEIQKSQSVRLRLVAQLDSGQLANAQVGSYYLLGKDSAVLLSTGFPAHIPGTADPIVAHMVFGDLDIVGVLKDIYWLTTLAWTKPDSVQRQPVTIKLADDWLEAVAAKTSEDDELSDATTDQDAPDF